MAQTSICRGMRTNVSQGMKVARKEGNKVTLDSGGWRTPTVKARMNQFANEFCGSRLCVYQKKWEWFVEVRDNSNSPFSVIARHAFADGMTVDLITGELVG